MNCRQPPGLACIRRGCERCGIRNIQFPTCLFTELAIWVNALVRTAFIGYRRQARWMQRRRAFIPGLRLDAVETRWRRLEVLDPRERRCTCRCATVWVSDADAAVY